MSRKIEDLKPAVQMLFKEFAAKMAEGGIPFILTRTYSTQEEQDAIYAQGRTKPGKVVTKTRHSKHTDRTAFDIAILKDGKPIWDAKVDIDKDAIPDYEEAGKIGEGIGLVWGGRFKGFYDGCHFEMRPMTGGNST